MRRVLLMCAVAITSNIWAQTFDSGSDGSDGDFTLTTPGSYDFFDVSIFDRPVNTDGDGIYHFTSVTIGFGVTLRMQSISSGPVTWLVSGDVIIDGVIDLNGRNGQPNSGPNAVPGAGGFSGGTGGNRFLLPTNGLGLGGGLVIRSDPGSSVLGGGGGHLLNGQGFSNSGGERYGNDFLLPLIGGSGGAGGYSGSTSLTTVGGGGGAGGGAILIAASGEISLIGLIIARGGNGSGSGTTGGGGGSGGAVRLVSQSISGNGRIDIDRGSGQFSGSPGRARIESHSNNFTGGVTPTGIISSPGLLFLPDNSIPIKITRIAGQAVPGDPNGQVNPPDLTLNSVGAAIVELEARGIPVGTVVQVTVVGDTGSVTVDSTPLSGTHELSIATASIVIPAGLTRIYAKADWDPN